ncbi:MAG: ethanolamine utilization protein EutN [Calditrichaeota bacterium]|nr:MAG: ethanolamine utilization protein EutN [Calditrichota bacterium]
MFLAKVVGNIWATQKHSEVEGHKMMLIQPINSELKKIGDEIVALDFAGVGVGEIVFYVTSKEAIVPMKNPLSPVDAGIIGIVDRVDK